MVETVLLEDPHQRLARLEQRVAAPTVPAETVAGVPKRGMEVEAARDELRDAVCVESAFGKRAI